MAAAVVGTGTDTAARKCTTRPVIDIEMMDEIEMIEAGIATGVTVTSPGHLVTTRPARAGIVRIIAAGTPGTAARHITQCKAADVSHIGARTIAAGTPGTAARHITQCKTANVSHIGAIDLMRGRLSWRPLLLRPVPIAN